MTAGNRIDIHQHVLAPVWVEGLHRRRSAHRPPAWSPEAALAFMDARRIERGILSLTAPGVADWSEDEHRGIVREVNDYTASLKADRPGRFGAFASLPLPDMEGALREVGHALDTLRSEGVVLMSNYGGRYLGDPWFEPLWAELDRRQAIVFVHPTRSALTPLDGIPPPFVDFPSDTTRTAVDMVLKGVLDRHRRLRVILAHAGGYLPYAAHRFATLAASHKPDSYDADALLATFRRFYFDTALSSSPATMPSLRAFADPARILLGTDFPYVPGGMAETVTATLDGNPLLSEAEHAAIGHGNAATLLSGLGG